MTTLGTLNEAGTLIVRADGLFVPVVPGNSDYDNLMAAAAKGTGAIAPYAPPNPTAEQLRMAAYKADPTRQNLITLIQGSTPAQVNTWLTTNVTTLAQARAVLAQLILFIGGNSVQ